MKIRNKNDHIDPDQIELGNEFSPEFNEHGLIPCIVVDSQSADVLMFAWMNKQALQQTFETNKATFFSRSRNKIWVKGEESGRIMKVQQMLIDCDQDVIQIKVRVEKEGACHRGYRTCFYREIDKDDISELNFTESSPVFDPDKIYGE